MCSFRCGCRGVGLGVFATFGIGYSILEVVARAITRFLSLFHLTPIRTEAVSGPDRTR
ncbi:hypothetical protein BH20ACT5_BH20ACT5_04310 [soil metagenome]